MQASEATARVNGPRAPAEGEPNWRRQLAEAIRDPDVLWHILDLPPALLPAARLAAKTFPLLVPRGFVDLMRRGDPADPLLRQVLPLDAELADVPGYSADPLREADHSPLPGVLCKYQGRALIVTTGACAVHCRYCFRRHFPYADVPRGPGWWRPAVDLIAGDSSIREVLLSGGDPLMLPDGQLAALAADLAAVPHLVRLRVHSRLPIVLPARVDDALLAWFASNRLQPVMVIHANHPQELGVAAVAACRRLRDAGVTVLNQSVLLRGVNDEVAVLADLSERLFAAGVLPYYLHQLDAVAGAAHFAVSDADASVLASALAARLPGYLVPRLVREIPGESGKSPLPWR